MAKKITIFALSLLFFTSFSVAQDSTYIRDMLDNQESVYMCLKVGGINGESFVFGHEDEIDLLTWEWEVSQTGSMNGGRGGARGLANVEDLIITKYVDKASPLLLLTCLTGSHLREAILTIGKHGDDNFEYLIITMDSVQITSVMSGGSHNHGRATERVSLKFAKVKFSYTPQKTDGSADATIDMTWNIERHSPE